MKKHFYQLAAIGISVAVIYSCSRTKDLAIKDPPVTPGQGLTLSAAKAFYSKTNQLSAARARAVTPEGAHSLASGVFVGEPDWTKYRFSDSNWLHVALDEGAVPQNGRTYYRNVVIMKDATGTLRQCVYLMEPDGAYLQQRIMEKGPGLSLTRYIDGSFTGTIWMYTINNHFLRAMRFSRGQPSAYLVPKRLMTTARAATGSKDYNTEDDPVEEDEVTVIGYTHPTPPPPPDPMYPPDVFGYPPGDVWPTDYIPPSGQGNPDSLKPNPCDELNKQNTSQAYKDKVTELKGKTNLKYETGYRESKTGTFTALNQAASGTNSDGLNMDVTADTKGAIHTHQDEYETGETDNEGNVKTRRPIKMFSPADVDILMQMADKNRTSGDFSDLYVSMVTSSGNYTLKFTGTATDIKTGFQGDDWKTQYRDFMQRGFFGGPETRFLRFLKEKMGISGVSLYKVDNNGRATKRSLNSNNNVESTPCPTT